MDKIDEIVERAIDYTDLVLINTPDYADAAIGGLRRLRDTLAVTLPNHPALQRLSDRIAELESRPNSGEIH